MHSCDQLCPHIQHKDTCLRKCISVEQRVGITLWCLATCWEYRSIAHLFGVARGTVCKIVNETCRAIVDTLLSQYIHFPNSVDEIKAVADGFKTKFGMIQCLEAIDGSHIPVMPPALDHTDYYNRKGYYSHDIASSC